jgi:4-hydroxy-3-methylbut-2-enyl diphosphate reductase
MKIIVASTAGFCMGVRRAVELALDTPARHDGPIYTYGPLIHNPQVLAMFAEKGITILKEIPEKGAGTVILRAHGVPPSTKQRIKQAGFKVIDATCPRVVKVQSIIKSHARKGFATIIVGDQDHPEVISLLGFAEGNGHVVGSLPALQALPEWDRAVVVAQTTQNEVAYREVKAWVAAHRPHYKVFDTICDSTEKRQAEVRRLAQEVDAVIVVGGKESGNTRRLAEIAAEVGRTAYHVETEEELDLKSLTRMNVVGITAGASTPTWIVKSVFRAVEQLPMTRSPGWLTAARRLTRFVLLTNLYVALGAGGLCLAMISLLELDLRPSVLAVAFLYILSMHTLNHLTGRKEDKYNEPDREKFYTRYKSGLTVMALSAGGLGLLAAMTLGAIPFWTLLTMSLLGLSYNLRFFPVAFFPRLKYRRIRDLPGSKTVLIALAWGVVTAILPALVNGRAGTAGCLAVIAWAIGFVFCRTAFFDILDMQGDRIVGKETIPLLMGMRRAIKLLKVILAVMLVMLPLLAVAGILSPLAYALTICPLLLGVVIATHEQHNAMTGIRIELMVESLFILSGVLSLVYHSI